MTINYLKIPFRQIKRNKLFTTINVIGLTLSISCVLLLFLYISEELSYEQHQPSNLYRATSHMSAQEGMDLKVGSNSLPVGPVSMEVLPEIVAQTRMLPTIFFGGNDKIQFEDNNFKLDIFYAADSNFFEVLNYEFAYGSPETALQKSSDIVIDLNTSTKLFGTENPIGKTVSIIMSLGKFDFTISGVVDLSQTKTDFKFDVIIPLISEPFKGFINQNTASWLTNNMVFTFIQLHENASVIDTEKKMNELLMQHGGEEAKQLGITKKLFLQPITDIHFDTSYEYDVPNKTSYIYIQIMISIAVIVLLLACVNYVNLSTAQAGQRAKEVGIRKVMGVTPLRLRAQFLWESSIIVIISLLLSVFVAEVSIPFFNSIIGSSLEFSQNNMWTIALFLLLFLVVIVILAGIYPAFYLSRFNPSEVLKSRSSVSGSSNFLRKFLVVFQFMITISLISSILIINRQFDFIRKSGISDKNTSQVVISMNNKELHPYYDVIKDGFSAISGIEAVAGTSNIPGSATSDMLLYAEGKTMEEAVYTLYIQAEGNYIDLMGYKIVSGRNFNSNWTVDRDAKRVIVNEKFVNDLGFTSEEAIGEKVYADFGEMHIELEIIGVIENFHQLSLHKEISGVVFSLTEGKIYNNLILNVNSSQYEDIMLQAKSVWDNNVEGHPFEPTLLDDLLMQQYKKDSDTFNLILFFSVLSVIISCLGLYAMSVFIAERKFKEIGVRKAMGASLGNIVALVSFGMTKLLIISFVLSVPIVYFAAQEWLKTFAYHIPIEYTVFIFSGIISLFIGWGTISYQTLKAAYTNPSEVLKDE